MFSYTNDHFYRTFLVVIKVPLPAQADASKKCAIESVRCLAMLKLIHLKLKLGWYDPYGHSYGHFSKFLSAVLKRSVKTALRMSVRLFPPFWSVSFLVLGWFLGWFWGFWDGFGMVFWFWDVFFWFWGGVLCWCWGMLKYCFRCWMCLAQRPDHGEIDF